MQFFHVSIFPTRKNEKKKKKNCEGVRHNTRDSRTFSDTQPLNRKQRTVKKKKQKNKSIKRKRKYPKLENKANSSSR